MVTRAIALWMDAYELLGTDEPWKYRWMTSVRDRVALRLFPGAEDRAAGIRMPRG
jgi:hypothetical protein